MTESAGSPMPSGKHVSRAAVVTHGKPGQIGAGFARLQAVAQDHGVELVLAEEEAQKHGVEASDEQAADLAVVLGGDGTVLRALARFLGSGVPVIGVNFGRVGFLSSMGRRELEEGLGRVFAGEYDVVALPTLELDHPDGRTVAVNDVVVSSASLGRMIELELAVGGEELGRQPCDGIICSTPSGSTAYNLSNGGPVLMWGLEAIALTYVAAHSLHARPIVIPAGADVIVWNRSADVEAGVLVDGRRVSTLGKADRAVIRLGAQRSLLATLPEATFVRRYRQSFASLATGGSRYGTAARSPGRSTGGPTAGRFSSSRALRDLATRGMHTRICTTGSESASSCSIAPATALRVASPNEGSRSSPTTPRSCSTISVSAPFTRAAAVVAVRTSSPSPRATPSGSRQWR